MDGPVREMADFPKEIVHAARSVEAGRLWVTLMKGGKPQTRLIDLKQAAFEDPGEDLHLLYEGTRYIFKNVLTEFPFLFEIKN